MNRDVIINREEDVYDYLSWQQSFGNYADVNWDVGYLVSEYMEWLMDSILPYNRYAPWFKEPPVTYYDLLTYLYDAEFVYTIDDDEHRYIDGMSLRRRFAIITNMREEEEELLVDYYPCSMLEMMVALALKIEEQIMSDPAYGNRTGQWFWYMIRSLGLNHQIDGKCSKEEVFDILDRFFKHEYEPNGLGGLFYIPTTDEDLSKKSIWYQTMRYLDTQA